MRRRSTIVVLLTTFTLLALVLGACVTSVPAQPAAEEAAAPAEPTAEVAEPAAEVEEAEPAEDVGTFSYWGGLIFSEAANNMLVERIEEWGQLRGVDVEVVMINQNETVQRVSAAIEAGTMPDALDMGRGQMLLLSEQGQLQPLDELYDEIGDSLGGWLNAANQATDPELYGGHRYGIPFSLGGNVLYRRADILEPLGFTEAPATWEEVADMSRAAQDPPNYYGMGFALSDVGDGNLTQSMLRSWGGRIADDAGENCTIDSPETRAFLEWISQAWDDGLFPPGVTTYDGAGDNVAYQSGTAIFIANPGSVFLYMRDEDPELGEATKYSGLPGGPVMRVSPVDANLRVIPTSTNEAKTELAKDLFKFLAEPEFMDEYYFHAIYGPAAEAYRDAPIFTESAVHEGLLDLAVNGTFGAFPDVNNAALAEYDTNFLTPRMIQRIVVDGLSIDESIAETQAACQEIYDKYK
jgi:multiple sugar transport system substrate-binding protein